MPVTAVETVPVLEVVPALAPAFTSAAASSMSVTTVDTVPMLEVEPKVQLQKLYNDSEFCKPRSSQHITSKVTLHRPLPWPSFMGVHTAGDEARCFGVEPWSEMLGRLKSSYVKSSHTIQMQVAAIVNKHTVARESAIFLSILDRHLKELVLQGLKAYDSNGLVFIQPSKMSDGSEHRKSSSITAFSCLNSIMVCTSSDLRCWNEVVLFLNCGWFANECVQSASELVNRFCTGVHVHESATCLIGRLLRVGSNTSSIFLNLAKTIVLPRTKQAKLRYILVEHVPFPQHATGLRSLFWLQGSAYYSHPDQSCKSNRKHGCEDFSQADHSGNLALIPFPKLELAGVASVLYFLEVQGAAGYPCVFAIVQKEHKNSHMLLLPWVLEQKNLSICFQLQLNIVLDDWCIIVRSVRLAVHVFALPVEKCYQNWLSLQSASGLDTLVLRIQYVVLKNMDYWWPTTAILTETGGIYSAGSSKQMSSARFSTDHSGTAICLLENGFALLEAYLKPGSCALASMITSLLEAWFKCVPPICIDIKTESFQGSGGMLQCVPSYHLGKHFSNNTCGSYKSSISRHSHLSKAGIAWDLRGCMFALLSCERWWTASESTPLHSSDRVWWSLVLLPYASRNWWVAWVVEDLLFSTCCGQAHSQEGRYALIRVQLSLDYIAFLSQTPILYDCYLDKTQSFTTFCSDLINYHDDTGTIKEVHAPWDPGKYPLKNLAWGQAKFQEGRNVMGLPYIVLVGPVSWVSSDGLGPSKLSEATYTLEEAPNTPSVWITNRTPLFPCSVFLSSPTSGYLLL